MTTDKQTNEFPAGAIENGREHFRRLAEHYDFDCEAGPLRNCYDFEQAQRCFEWLVDYIQGQETPDPHADQIKALRGAIRAAHEHSSFPYVAEGKAVLLPTKLWNRIKALALTKPAEQPEQEREAIGHLRPDGWRSMESAPRDGTEVLTGCRAYCSKKGGWTIFSYRNVRSRFLSGKWCAEFGSAGWKPLEPQPDCWKPASPTDAEGA